MLTLVHENRGGLCDLRLRLSSRTPEIVRCWRQENAMPQYDVSVRWKIAGDCNSVRLPSRKPFFLRELWRFGSGDAESLAIRKFWCIVQVFRVGFWQNGFLRIFVFGPPDFFADFVAEFFLLVFVGERVPSKILQKNPWQSPPQSAQQKSPTHFCRGAGPASFRAL